MLSALRPEQYEDDQAALATAAAIETQFAEPRPEAVRMLLAILRGSQMGPESGWFGPAERRYTWEWLTAQHDLPADAPGIARDVFRGPADAWARLDRNGDGTITRDDLDWSDRHPWVQASNVLQRAFRRLDAHGDGRLTRDEWLQFFDQVAAEKEHLTSDDLRQALMPPARFSPGDAPTRAMLVQGLFSGEIGSLQAGAKLDSLAPDFTLSTPDGATSYQLSQLIGERPVVLMFGNFTCGPFRACYPEVENVWRRHRHDTNFLMVYVREAHPTDGWRMESNAQAQVAVAQPTTLAQRMAACRQFIAKAQAEVPIVVDEINDPVGHAYSAMPARLFVIDRAGRIAYKSGRGPFGFRAGEMEQALVMTHMAGA